MQDGARALRRPFSVPVISVHCGLPALGLEGDVATVILLMTDLIVQATPVGMRKGDAPPLLEASAFRAGQMVFDLVYTAPETEFMRQARAGGALAANGLGMLLHQGAAAFSIWTGKESPVSVMRKALEKAVYGAT